MPHWMYLVAIIIQMDARSLAVEVAPIIMWQKGQRPEHYKHVWNQPQKLDSKANIDSASNYSAWGMLAGDFAV